MRGEDWKEFLESGAQAGLTQVDLDNFFQLLRPGLENERHVWVVVRALSREIRRQRVALTELAESNAALRTFRDAAVVGGE